MFHINREVKSVNKSLVIIDAPQIKMDQNKSYKQTVDSKLIIQLESYNQ